MRSASGRPPGALFLDEVGDLPLALQPKLLRLLQGGATSEVGETQTRASNVSGTAATNHGHRSDIAGSQFREDPYYRLNVIEVTLPPLRQRTHDILPLAEHLLRFFARQNNKAIAGFAPPVKEAAPRQYYGPATFAETAPRGRAGRDPGPRPR